MRVPSRRMPAAHVHKTPLWAYPIVLGSLGWAIFRIGRLLYLYPLVLLLAIPLSILAWFLIRRDNLKWQHLAASRSDESICDFARSFDYRRTDTWILRAVYEELSRYISRQDQPFSIRADDRLDDDGLIDSEDLCYVVVDIAARAGRSLANPEQNPYYDKVHSVRDLVHYLEQQPKLDVSLAPRLTSLAPSNH
jgi:hypothetical protein